MKNFKDIVLSAIVAILLTSSYADNKRQLSKPIETPVYGLNDVPDEAVVNQLLPKLNSSSVMALRLVNRNFCNNVNHCLGITYIVKAIRLLTVDNGKIPGDSPNVFVNFSNLTSLDISDTEGFPSESFKDLQKLKTLSLRFSEKVDPKGLRHLTNIEKMDLGHCEWVNDRSLQFLAGLKILTSINLDNTNITDAGLKVFGPLNIKHVSLDKTIDVYDYTLRELALLFNDLYKADRDLKTPIAKNIGLFFDTFNVLEGNIKILKNNMKALIIQRINQLSSTLDKLKDDRKYNIIQSRINQLHKILNQLKEDKGSIKANTIKLLLNSWNKFANDTERRRVKLLKSYFNNVMSALGSITDRGVKNFAGATVVSLVGNDAITDNSLYALSGVKQIDLRGCDEITDIGLEQHLASSVEIIYLSENENITGAGISSLKKLETLYLYKCPKITEADLMKLSKSLSNFELLLEDPGILSKENRVYLNKACILQDFDYEDLHLALWPFKGLA